MGHQKVIKSTVLANYSLLWTPQLPVPCQELEMSSDLSAHKKQLLLRDLLNFSNVEPATQWEVLKKELNYRLNVLW